jgi:hypothetical protein
LTAASALLTVAGLRLRTLWRAIFEPNEPMDCEHEEIEPEDPDLVRVLADYALTLG